MKKLQETGFMRLPQVLELIPFGKSTLWNKVKDNSFPQPVKLGPKITAWRCEDIRAYIDQPTKAAAQGGGYDYK